MNDLTDIKFILLKIIFCSDCVVNNNFIDKEFRICMIENIILHLLIFSRKKWRYWYWFMLNLMSCINQIWHNQEFLKYWHFNDEKILDCICWKIRNWIFFDYNKMQLFWKMYIHWKNIWNIRFWAESWFDYKIVQIIRYICVFDFQKTFYNKKKNLQKINNMLSAQKNQILKTHENNSLSYTIINDDEKSIEHLNLLCVMIELTVICEQMYLFKSISFW